MSYIEHNLSPKEKLIIRPTIHWFVLLNGPLISTAGFMLHSDAFISGTGSWLVNSNTHKWWYTVSHYDMEELIEFGINIVPILAILFGVFMFCVGLYRKLGIDMGITSRRIVLKKGLFHTDTEELSFNDIESITIFQSPFGKFLDFGDIYFTGISYHSANKREIIFKWVNNPSKIRRVALAGLDAYAPATPKSLQ